MSFFNQPMIEMTSKLKLHKKTLLLKGYLVVKMQQFFIK
jgi:hypothetical protein